MEPVPAAARLVYTVEQWPVHERHRHYVSLEDLLNSRAREGKTLAYVIPVDGITLVFTSPMSYP